MLCRACLVVVIVVEAAVERLDRQHCLVRMVNVAVPAVDAVSGVPCAVPPGDDAEHRHRAGVRFAAARRNSHE